ncbi:MAG: hypothetical protein BWX70_00306 [Verrucomicrobia bacterium ADurb.Bin070]|nr:MAG: hypothetical protein BWX70_00306 [Verrucomicrobia bacterium ADurb.Bin070]
MRGTARRPRGQRPRPVRALLGQQAAAGLREILFDPQRVLMVPANLDGQILLKLRLIFGGVAGRRRIVDTEARRPVAFVRIGLRGAVPTGCVHECAGTVKINRLGYGHPDLHASAQVGMTERAGHRIGDRDQQTVRHCRIPDLHREPVQARHDVAGLIDRLHVQLQRPVVGFEHVLFVQLGGSRAPQDQGPLIAVRPHGGHFGGCPGRRQIPQLGCRLCQRVFEICREHILMSPSQGADLLDPDGMRGFCGDGRGIDQRSDQIRPTIRALR